MDQKIFFDNI